MRDAATLRSVLKALSGDEQVDWDAAESGASNEDSRLLLQELRVISQISAVHASAPGSSPGARVLPFRLGPDERWGTLRVLALLGTGADGDVYRAYDERLQREVALKLLRRPADDRGVSHALDEARLLARVRHPNIVTVHGADVVDGQAGIWMELVAGETLQSQVSRQGPFGADEAALIGAELCRGLAAIHQAGILHRDVKAQNVMRESGGRIVLMDFSVSRAGDSQRQGLAGTPVYVAPELFTGAPASPRSDIYGVGVLLYYLVTGTYPTTGATIVDIAQAHQDRRTKRLRDARADLPAAFVATVDRALSGDPALRPASAGELEGALLESLTRQTTDRSTLLPGAVRRPRWILGSIAAALLIAAAAISSQWPSRSEPPSAVVPLEARPWILVSAFDNRTADRNLDGVLEYALERELTSSSQFRVASRPRVDDALRLMRRPVETRLDPGTAREVALRDGGIRTLISGRVEQVGTVTVLSASVMDVQSGASVASLSEDASGVNELQQAVRRLSNRLRQALGETSAAVRLSTQQLEKVTTPSLTALRLYTESYAAGERDHWPAAMNLAKQAVEEDPSFAAAHTWLAWSMMRNHLPKDAFMPAASKAVSLSGSATEWERLWITASYYSLEGDSDRAIGAYEALVRVSPDHFWGSSNLIGLYRLQGRDADGVAIASRLVELRPHDYNVLYMALDRMRLQGNLEQASEYARRIRSIGVYNRNPSGDAWVFDAFLAWHRRDPGQAVRELKKVQDEALVLDPELRDAILRRTSMLYLSLGRPGDARDALGLALPSAEWHLLQGALAFAVDDLATAQRETRAARVTDLPASETDRVQSNQWTLAMWLLSRSGDTGTARQLLATLDPIARQRTGRVGPAAADVLAGELALAEGAADESIRRLSNGGWGGLSDGPMFRATETLADALVRNGDLAAAADRLQKVSAIKHRAAYDYAYWWMRCQLRLAEIHQQLGRHAEATMIARELATMLGEAEPGFPMVERVRAILGDR